MDRYSFTNFVARPALVFLLVVSFLWSGNVPQAQAAAPLILRVTTTAQDLAHCGSGWADNQACTLRHALSATPGAAGIQIWVKAGTYKPSSTGDRSATIHLRSNIAIYGGFAGTETELEQRDWEANPVILSGDLNGDDGPNFTGNEENSYHVVTGANNAILDGVTIQGGNANGGSLNDFGGGMFNNNSSPTLSNVTFSGNEATDAGGGMFNTSSSSPTLTNVTFSGNAAEYAGGGMSNSSSSPTLTNVTFSGNEATNLGSGGGMSNSSSSLTLTNVTFSSNNASHGGGMANDYSSLTLTNVTFSSNTASYGGGMHNRFSSPTLTNVTFNANTASDQGGGMVNAINSNPIIRNSILWGDSPNEVYNDLSTAPSNPTISYSDIQGGYAGTGNIDADPLFYATGNLRLQPASPAIDAGNNEWVTVDYDLDNTPRIGNGRVDMGAYERSRIYVDQAATGADHGTSWADAFTSLQTALTNAGSGDEIWVADGTYKPSNISNRSATFQLKSDVAIYGGFAGTEIELEQRDWKANRVILSGDQGGNDGPDFSGSEENSYHVVVGVNGAILDGVTIRGGNANGNSFPDNHGAGMFNFNDSSPTLNNIIFSSNAAVVGGGMYNNSHSNPSLTNVIFDKNRADWYGAMANYYDSNPTLTQVIFSNNTSSYRGGGIGNERSSPSLTNVIFSGNAASDLGGGMYNFSSSPTLTNVIFSNNTAGYGAGMANDDSSPTLTNVTFSANTAEGQGGGLYNTQDSNPIIRNSILWGDGPNEVYNDPSTTPSNPTFSYSVVQGGYTGTGNIAADPMLAPLGDYGGGMQTLALLPGSPAIDAAENCPSTDARGVQRSTPNCDMGAFESQGFTLAISGGNNQSTAINQAFAQPLVVSVTANAAVEPVNGGQVTFTPPASGASAVLSASAITISNGTASVNATANATPGEYTVTAATTGVATGVVFNLANKLQTSASLQLSATTVTAGQPITLTVTVSPIAPGAGTPTGTVTFMDGATVLGTAPLSATASGAQAAFTTSSLAIGTHSLTASYTGDGNYNASASSPVSLTVIANGYLVFLPTLGR